jgi:hypothetical protein
MSGEVGRPARIVQSCASTIEQSIVELIEMGEDERAERCKRALVALVGEDFGEEYAWRTITYAIEMTGRDLDDFERHQRHYEIVEDFAGEVGRLGDLRDFLIACDGDPNDEPGQ